MKTLSISSEEFASALDDLKYYFGFHKLEYIQQNDWAIEYERPPIDGDAENNPGIKVSCRDNRVSVYIPYQVTLDIPDGPFNIMEKYKALLSESPFDKRIRTLLFTLRWLTRRLGGHQTEIRKVVIAAGHKPPWQSLDRVGVCAEIVSRENNRLDIG